MPRVPVDVSASGTEGEVDDKDAVHPNVGQYHYTERERERLAADPEYPLKYRKRIEFAINTGFTIFYKNTNASQMMEGYMRAEMNRRLKNHPVLTVIVCATGYDMAWTPHFELIGRNGVDIKDSWAPTPKCYLGMAAPGFPNYFVINGPRGNLASGMGLPCLETEVGYVIQAANKMQSDRIRTLDVREDVVEQLDEYIDAWQETSVFSGPCRSWYKDNTRDGKVRVWGGSVGATGANQHHKGGS